MKSVPWTPDASITVSAFKADGDLWFTSRTLATLFGVTVQNIQIHVRDLQDSGQPVVKVSFPVKQNEGSRAVARHIKHYPFEIAHAIAVRSRRFRELGWLLDLSKEHGVHRPAYRIAPIKERAFGELLQGALQGIVSVLPQHHSPPHFIDFYIPAWRLAIEYDERYHCSTKQAEADAERQAKIERSLGATFVRVAVGKEIEALNQILKAGIESMKANHISNEVRGINRVSHDITSKPDGTI